MGIQECKRGYHNLVELLRAGDGGDVEYVARWCRNCGAAVVDIEYDRGLMSPGGIMKMTGPMINKK